MARNNSEPREPEIVTGLHLGEMAYGGETVGRIDDGTDNSQVVFVAGGLPGETVTAQLYRRKKSFLRANVRQVETASEVRRDAPCRYFGINNFPNCGGCQWQHAQYAAQLEFKHSIFREQLIRLGGFTEMEPPLLPPIPALNEWHYRNTVEMEVDKQNGRPSFHRQNSIRLVPVDFCHIAHNLISQAIEPVSAGLQRWLPGKVHQVTMRVGSQFAAVPELLLVLRMVGEWKVEEITPFAQELQTTLQEQAKVSVLGEGKKFRLEAALGLPYFTEQLRGVTYRVPALAFFQSNTPMAEVLLDTALDTLAETGLDFTNSRLLDIFCGVGTFALQMAKQGATVLGIEEYAGAVTAATANARLNGLENKCQFVAAKAEEYILELEEAGEQFNAALLDPPRRGCEPALLESLLKTRPPWLVYVSCDPSTLARDIKILSSGYQLVHSRVIDMFPQTYHMESVSLLKAI